MLRSVVGPPGKPTVYPITKIAENIDSEQAVLKIWSFIKTSSYGEANQNTFRRYVIRQLKKDRNPETMEDVIENIKENPFLWAVFQAAKENMELRKMFENILSFSLKPTARIPQRFLHSQIPIIPSHSHRFRIRPYTLMHF